MNQFWKYALVATLSVAGREVVGRVIDSYKPPMQPVKEIQYIENDSIEGIDLIRVHTKFRRTYELPVSAPFSINGLEKQSFLYENQGELEQKTADMRAKNQANVR